MYQITEAHPVGILVFTVFLLVKLNIKENKLIWFGKGSCSMELISVAATFDVLYKQGFPCWGSESWIINSVLPTQGLPSHQYQKKKKKKKKKERKKISLFCDSQNSNSKMVQPLSNRQQCWLISQPDIWGHIVLPWQVMGAMFIL